jgi:hypothetical protein
VDTVGAGYGNVGWSCAEWRRDLRRVAESSRLHTSRRCLLTGGAGLGTAKGTAVAALERIGGVMVYDVTNPAAPVFQQYRHTRYLVGATMAP